MFKGLGFWVPTLNQKPETLNRKFNPLQPLNSRAEPLLSWSSCSKGDTTVDDILP